MGTGRVGEEREADPSRWEGGRGVSIYWVPLVLSRRFPLLSISEIRTHRGGTTCYIGSIFPPFLVVHRRIS